MSIVGRLPVEVVFNPRWWYKNCGITFERDFFFDPDCRVENELKMRNYLYERFGDIGLGEKEKTPKAVIGPVHLAAGFLTSQLLGCDVQFNESAPPDVFPLNMTDEAVLKLEVPDLQTVYPFNELIMMMDCLESRYGRLEGDIDWNGVQNIALDLRGSQLFIDYFENPELVFHLFDVIAQTLVKVVNYIRRRTGSSSISVNRSVRHFTPSVNLHSNCSVTMISNSTYEEFLLKYDNFLSDALQPYGIHHCGNNMEVVAEGYSKVRNACFFDVGWGSDIKKCRAHLPNAFFNLRLSPVKLLSCSAQDVRDDILRLVRDNGGPENAGICCINIDYGTPDSNIRALYEAASELRG